MKIDEEKLLKEFVSQGIKIPPQPRVLIELNELLISGNYDNVRALAKLISQDPGITAMLFKAASSPVFARGKKLDTLDKVLQVIGVKQALNLAQAFALANSLSDSSRKAYEVFWARSMDVARLAALIAAERVSVCNVFPDQAFLAGVFHECGVPVLMQRFPDYCNSPHLQDACCGPILAEEDARFNVDHSVMGYLVARHWRLPDFICNAIRYHHEWPQDEAGTVITLVAILQMALHFYHRLARAEDPAWPSLSRSVLTELGLTPEDEEDFFELISERFLNG
jgi:HD-like signal output (HDOD) protein